MVILRVLARYWFIAPILLMVTALQLGFGFVVARNVANGDTPTQNLISRQSTQTVPAMAQSTPSTPTPRPTFTLTPSPFPSATPTFTPSPTRTPTHTPTGTLTPSSTPLSTHTPSPTHTSSPTPQPTPMARGTTVTVPILMYHYLSAPPAGADAIRMDLSVSPEQFETHLAYLRQAGYETISMAHLSLALSGQKNLPPRPVIITFDDGYRDNYTNAFPLLRQYGYIATFFIFTQPIDTNNVDYLSWDMVREMHTAGMEFGSHSYSHPDLRGKDDQFQIFEVLASKEAIEERTGEPVRFFAYPSGRYDELTIRVLQSANFWGGVTTQWGAEHSYLERFEMARIRIRGNDTAQALAEKLRLFEN